MRRTFITFADENFKDLSNVLSESINSFSEYKLKIYNPSDFNIKYEPEKWKTGYIYIYKVLSCIKALEEFDEVVWLDSDCLATYNIDKIWDNKIDNYPLLPKHRFYNFNIWPHIKIDHTDPEFLKDAKNKILVVDNSFSNTYLQACCMYFDKNCLNFFNEVLSYFNNYEDIFPYGDETIINCMIWRNKYQSNLGHVFLCSHYFSPYIIEEFIKLNCKEDFPKLFDISMRIDGIDEDNFILTHGLSRAVHNRIGLVNNNFDNILFFHGSKSVDLYNRYLELMKKERVN